MQFYSRHGLDHFVFETFFFGRRDGVFVDIGSYDGHTFNDTLFFERTMGWQGLCVEPMVGPLERLAATRKCTAECACLADREGGAEFIEVEMGPSEPRFGGIIEYLGAAQHQRLRLASGNRTMRRVSTVRLATLLQRHRLQQVDYCVIDASGAELSILSDPELANFHFSVLAVRADADAPAIEALLSSRGFVSVGLMGEQRVFRHASMQPLPKTSVICAVWHREPDRLNLLRGHAACLARQTVPVQPIYVFDGADIPPEWLPGLKVVVHEPTTIYQAWNIALARVSTPLVMNLNLDDRLAPDAVSHLQHVLGVEQAAMVGGDWKICYSQEETDSVEPCHAANDLPVVPDWPPPAGTRTRLGSGTGARGTFGPAVLWRMDTHLGAPRYAWRLPDGTPFRVAGDSAWWTVVTRHLGKKAVRSPWVIGNYHSHPATQAEFRYPDEIKLMGELGVSLL
jgi:FkbM family methyltransferase